MNNYDFSSLNDKDFEELVRDLLNKKLNLDLQSFKRGKDKGIDLRFSTQNNTNSIVVQSKHYFKTGIKGLFSGLKNEVVKVAELKPDRYIIATSISLNPMDKNKILEIFHPYLKNTNDIFGNEDLNKYLLEFNDIETKYFKLWLSSTNVLQKIINNAISGRSIFYSEKVKKEIEICVVNKSYNEAFEILKKYKFLILTGLPGVGKTTLSHIIICDYLAHDFELVYIDKDVKEAESLLSPDFNKKQIFFFDDFLGANYYEIINPKISDSSLMLFLERIKSIPNKYCILATRTTILNKARISFEKINRADFNIAQKEIELKEYTKYEKAKILYNHIYFSDILEEFKNKIFENKNYWKIINHENYNPRLIEFITNPYNLNDLVTDEYLSFILQKLDNPEEVWKHSFENQIDQDDRILILTLFTLNNQSLIGHLEVAYFERLKFEVNNYGYTISTNSFRNSMKRLLDGYINSTLDEKVQTINILNPSIGDFITNYLKNSKEERFKITNSLKFYKQYLKVYQFYKEIITDNSDDYYKEIVEIIHLIYSKRNDISFADREFSRAYSTFDKEIFIASLINSFTSLSTELVNLKDDLVFNLINLSYFSEVNVINFGEFINSISTPKGNGKIYNLILSDWDQLILHLLKLAYYPLDLEKIFGLFDIYEKNRFDFLGNENQKKITEEIVNEILISSFEDEVHDKKLEIYERVDYQKMIDDVESEWDELTNSFNLELEFPEKKFFNEDIDVLIEENHVNSTEYEPDWNDSISSNQNSAFAVSDIDNLFDRTIEFK